MFKKILIALCVFSFPMLVLQAQEMKAPDFQKEKPPVSFNPEDDAIINVFAALGYYKWMMISESDFMGLFTGKASGAGFSHDAEPFIVKRYGVKTNIAIIKFGLDYFSDKLSLPETKETTQDEEASKDRKARQLKLLGGVKLGSFVIETNAIFREFNSSITSKGYRDYTGTVTPLIYYPKDGVPQSLAPGDKASWYTKYREYDVRIVFPSPYLSMYAGVKYMNFDAPSSMSISYHKYTPPSTFVYGSGDILAFTGNRIINAFIGFASSFPVASHLYLNMSVPMTFMVPGGYKVESGLVRNKKSSPMAMESFSISSMGEVSLQLRLPLISMKAGVEYGFYSSRFNPSESTLKQNVSFYDTTSKTTINVPAGEKVDISINRLELFWGLYASASCYF